jgi:xanthine/uracil/vitamin C permease (AzgA family)
MPTVADPRRRPEGPLRDELRPVLGVAVGVVAVVLAVAAVAIFVPGVRDVFARLPIAIAVLIGGTAWVLWQITRRSPSP